MPSHLLWRSRVAGHRCQHHPLAYRYTAEDFPDPVRRLGQHSKGKESAVGSLYQKSARLSWRKRVPLVNVS